MAESPRPAASASLLIDVAKTTQLHLECLRENKPARPGVQHAKIPLDGRCRRATNVNAQQNAREWKRQNCQTRWRSRG